VIPVHEALEHSSDVAAVKLALKIGPTSSTIHSRLRIWQRTGIELPGETRGLLRP
jgi:cell division protein FtsI (penicillin-binding protein 3)